MEMFYGYAAGEYLVIATGKFLDLKMNSPYCSCKLFLDLFTISKLKPHSDSCPE